MKNQVDIIYHTKIRSCMNKDSYFQFDSFDFNLFVSKTFVAVLEHSCFAKVVDCLGSSLKP